LLHVVLPGEGEIFHLVPQAAKHFFLRPREAFTHVRRNHAMKETRFEMVAGDEQSQSFQPPA
jgi:hypothetical protein